MQATPHPPANANPKGTATTGRPHQLTTPSSTAVDTAIKNTPKTGFARHKKPTLDEVVDSVFHSVTGDYGEAKGFDVPANFEDFYHNPLFRHFLACIVYYYFGFVDVRKLEHRLDVQRQEEGQPPPVDVMDTGGGAPAGTSHTTDVNIRELHFSQLELRRRLRLVGEAYSRLLLNCSNFEHTSEDKRFFEFIFEFTRSVTRLAIDKKYWDEMEQSLSYLFRGYMFNNPSLRSKVTQVGSTGGDSGDVTGVGEDQAAAATTKAINKSSTPNKGTEPIDLARRVLAKYRSRVTGAPRARGIRALRRMRKKRLNEAASNDVATGLLPAAVSFSANTRHGKNVRRHATHRNMSSVREIINARSPLVSMLLPTAAESSANARLTKKTAKHQKSRAAYIAVPIETAGTVAEPMKQDQVRSTVVAPRIIQNRSRHRKRGAALFDF